MSRSVFKQACEALWGPQYRSEAARQLGISLRTMMRYDNGDSPVPVVLFERVNKLLAKRESDLAKLQLKVAAAVEGGEA